MFDQVMNYFDLLIGKYFFGCKKIVVLVKCILCDKKKLLKLKGVCGNNLQNVNLEILVGLFICIIGVLGFGKLMLINNILFLIIVIVLNGVIILEVVLYDLFDGLQYLDKVVDIDQSLIGCILCFNLVIYIGLFMLICELFFGVLEVCLCGYGFGCFLFNVKGGCCEVCQGDGVIKVEMYFLLDIYVFCDVCKGKCYNCEILEICYKGKSIYEVLEMIIEEVCEFFDVVFVLVCKLQMLMDVGLFYIKLGQSVIIFLGGEV